MVDDADGGLGIADAESHQRIAFLIRSRLLDGGDLKALGEEVRPGGGRRKGIRKPTRRGEWEVEVESAWKQGAIDDLSLLSRVVRRSQGYLAIYTADAAWRLGQPELATFQDVLSLGVDAEPLVTEGGPPPPGVARRFAVWVPVASSPERPEQYRPFPDRSLFVLVCDIVGNTLVFHWRGFDVYHAQADETGAMVCRNQPVQHTELFRLGLQSLRFVLRLDRLTPYPLRQLIFGKMWGRYIGDINVVADEAVWAHFSVDAENRSSRVKASSQRLKAVKRDLGAAGDPPVPVDRKSLTHLAVLLSATLTAQLLAQGVTCPAGVDLATLCRCAIIQGLVKDVGARAYAFHLKVMSASVETRLGEHQHPAYLEQLPTLSVKFDGHSTGGSHAEDFAHIRVHRPDQATAVAARLIAEQELGT